MAVPSAVLKQREKLTANLAAQGLDEHGQPIETPPVQPIDLDTPAVVPVVEQLPQTPPQVALSHDLNAEVQELRAQLKTQDGRVSAATTRENEANRRAEVLAMQISSLEETVATLQQQVEQAEVRATGKAVQLPSLDMPDDLTPDEKEKFDSDTIKFVEKLSKRELVQAVKPLMDKVSALEKRLELSGVDKVPQLEKTLRTNQAESERRNQEAFFNKEVLAYYPDFVNVRSTQGWKDFLVAEIPEKGIKNGHLLEHYKNTNNAQGIRALLQSYYNSVKEKPTLASIATPRGAQTEGMPVVKPKMKASEYQKNLRLFTSRRLAQPEWEKFKSAFNTALNEDRVDMDVRL